MRTIIINQARPEGRVGVIRTNLRLGETSGSGPLIGLINSRTVTREQLSTYIGRFGLGPDGRYERMEQDRGVIKIERTIPQQNWKGILDTACLFAEELETCFPGVSFQIV